MKKFEEMMELDGNEFNLAVLEETMKIMEAEEKEKQYPLSPETVLVFGTIATSIEIMKDGAVESNPEHMAAYARFCYNTGYRQALKDMKHEVNPNTQI